MTGIYILRNKKNGKVYVGQSKNLSHRKSCHLYDLEHNRHKNEMLQSDYNNNPEIISFEIVCTCEEECLDDMERYYIKKYDSINSGYNIISGGKKDYNVPDGTKTKMSKAKIGNKSMVGIKLSDEWKKHLAEAQPHRKRVRCIETGIIYPSFAEASRQTGLERTKIVSNCTGHRKSVGGYHFEYADERTSDNIVEG